MDDARTWGRIAAVNSASDVYAMGARPLFALNLAAWPRDVLPLDLLAEVLAGGADAATAGGWIVAGGHTIDGPEPVYGMSLTGIIEDPSVKVLTNADGRAGQALVLTKPIGTGLLATAIKRSGPEATVPGGPLNAAYEAGVAEMCRLNADAADAAREAGATAVTDVTGFGLLGHLAEMTAAAGVGANIDASAVPLLVGAADLAKQGFAAGGTLRNLEYLARRLDGGDELTRNMLADPQTSGGLLFSCHPGRVGATVRALCDSGHNAATIGELSESSDGIIAITGSVAPSIG